MAEDYGMMLVRVVRGEESLASAFWFSLAVMLVYFAYEYYIPTFTGVFLPLFHFFDVFWLTYTLVAIHHSSHDSALFPRLAARTYVLLLLMAAGYIVYTHYGVYWAAGYPIIAFLAGFLVKE